LRLNELETLLFTQERIPVAKNALVTESTLQKFKNVPLDICNENKVPERKAPDLLREPVQSLQKTLQKAGNFENESNSNSNSNSGRIRKILEALKKLMSNPHESIEVFPCQRNIGFWRILIKGPATSPYEGGTWLAYVSFPDDYPIQAPEIRFVTPIKHCNVNPYGKICHSIFTRNWTADTTVRMVLDCVYGLLLYPETDDPIDSNLAMIFFNNKINYEKGITEHVKKHAKAKSAAEWRAELLQDEDADSSTLCKICMGFQHNIVFIPCGHLCCCENCSGKITHCPICRALIEKKQKIHST